MDPAPTTMNPDQTTPDPTTLDFLHFCSFFYLSPNVFIRACKITASSLLSFCEKQHHQRLREGFGNFKSTIYILTKKYCTWWLVKEEKEMRKKFEPTENPVDSAEAWKVQCWVKKNSRFDGKGENCNQQALVKYSSNPFEKMWPKIENDLWLLED